MSAQVIRLPVIERWNYGNPAWLEQRDRELAAFASMRRQAPPRTRPIPIPSEANAERIARAAGREM